MKKSFISLLCMVLVIILCSCSVTTANFTDLKMTTEIDKENKPLNVTDTFAENAPVIYATGILNNAPEGTKIRADWRYIESDPAVDIDSVTYDTTEITTAFNFSLSKPTNGWPAGKYEVKLYIDDTYKESLNFKVE